MRPAAPRVFPGPPGMLPAPPKMLPRPPKMLPRPPKMLSGPPRMLPGPPTVPSASRPGTLPVLTAGRPLISAVLPLTTSGHLAA